MLPVCRLATSITPSLTLAQDFPLLCPLPAFAAGSTLEDRRPSSQFGGVLFDFVEAGINRGQAVLCRALGT